MWGVVSIVRDLSLVFVIKVLVFFILLIWFKVGLRMLNSIYLIVGIKGMRRVMILLLFFVSVMICCDVRVDLDVVIVVNIVFVMYWVLLYLRKMF